jgi:hypothetical protein
MPRRIADWIRLYFNNATAQPMARKAVHYGFSYQEACQLHCINRQFGPAKTANQKGTFHATALFIVAVASADQG